MVRLRGRGRGHLVGQDRRLPRGLPLLQPVGPVRHAGAGHALPRHRRGAGRGPRDRRAGRRRSSASCWPCAAPTSAPWPASSSWCRWCGRRPASTSPCRPGSSPRTRPGAWPRGASTATTTTWRRPGPTSTRSSPATASTSASPPASMVLDNDMELCCGVLMGMGETVDQRLELLEELRAAGPGRGAGQLPQPTAGTPFAHLPAVEPLEAIRWIALFRLGLPEVILRYAGGREFTLRDLQAMGMTSGINALIIGNYLTYLGRSPCRGPQDARRPAHAHGRPRQGPLRADTRWPPRPSPPTATAADVPRRTATGAGRPTTRPASAPPAGGAWRSSSRRPATGVAAGTTGR